MDFDCDTLADRFSRWSAAIGIRDFEAQGKLRFAEERSHPRWLPTGMLTFSAGDETYDVFATQAVGEALRIGTRHRISANAALESATLGELEATREPIPFVVRGAGPQVEATLGGVSSEITLRAPVDTFGMSCNTANVVFEGVTITLR